MKFINTNTTAAAAGVASLAMTASAMAVNMTVPVPTGSVAKTTLSTLPGFDPVMTISKAPTDQSNKNDTVPGSKTPGAPATPFSNSTKPSFSEIVVVVESAPVSNTTTETSFITKTVPAPAAIGSSSTTASAPKPTDKLQKKTAAATATKTSPATPAQTNSKQPPQSSSLAPWEPGYSDAPPSAPKQTVYPNADPPSCIVTNSGFGYIGWNTYRIRAYNIPDVPGHCDRFWFEIHQHDPPCRLLTDVHCEEPFPNVIDIRFGHVLANCNPGTVESSWWEMTHNQYGAMTCKWHDKLKPEEKRKWHGWVGKNRPN